MESVNNPSFPQTRRELDKTFKREAAASPGSLGSGRMMSMIKIQKGTGIICGVAALLALLTMADHSPSSGWSLRSSPRSGWHLEAGYLIDFTPSEVHTWHLSGSWYRLGPIQINQKWRSRMVVTNQPDMDKIWKIF